MRLWSGKWRLTSGLGSSDQSAFKKSFKGLKKEIRTAKMGLKPGFQRAPWPTKGAAPWPTGGAAELERTAAQDNSWRFVQF